MPKPSYFVFDIETVADGRLVQQVRYPDQPQLTRAEAVAQYRAQLMEQNGSDFIPGTFQVPVSIAVVLVGSDFRIQKITTIDRPKQRPQVIARQFWQGWRQYGRPTFVTFNGRGFDIPVMELCAFRYGIPIREWYQIGLKSWEDPRNRFNVSGHIDLQEVLTNHGAMRFNGGLNLAARLLGKPGKMDTKGDMVQDLWQQGELEQIDDYCICDALDTYFVFLRSLVMQGRLTVDEEHERVLEAKAEVEGALASYPALQDYLDGFHVWQPVADDADPFLPDPDNASDES